MVISGLKMIEACLKSRCITASSMRLDLQIADFSRGGNQFSSDEATATKVLPRQHLETCSHQ